MVLLTRQAAGQLGVVAAMPSSSPRGFASLRSRLADADTSLRRVCITDRTTNHNALQLATVSTSWLISERLRQVR